MKFNFKTQQYQTDAVTAVCDVFAGQGYYTKTLYRRDLGKKKKEIGIDGKELPQWKDVHWLGNDDDEEDIDLDNDTGYKNELIYLSNDLLLKNINQIQSNNNIKTSDELIGDLGRCSLDIEMETGTGKTYVYIKTMFELNKRYGWSKFIVVVPSIAIREGVAKTFEITADHFMRHYGKKARFFIYNSSNLTQIDNFSASAGINVMIINTQAFAASLKEDGKSKEARIIYSKQENFASRKPIDVIKANNPIIILDEPQKMGGDVTQKALKNFNPLFTLNYSATHKKQNNLIYVLDALDAYNEKLVKKIQVKGFEVKNLRGTDTYLHLEKIVLSSKNPPKARIEFEKNSSTIKRDTKAFDIGDDIYPESGHMEQYKNGYTISDIDPYTNTVTFTNGETLSTGDVVGDVSENDMRRIQIRETILSHFEKEEALFNMGIKSLSLFFIDEVAKYREYDENGNAVLGEYAKVFEQEYINVLNEYITIFDTPYQKYLKEKCSDVSKVHNGYFSIDKKTGRSIDSQLKRGSEFSDDISAYELILKQKERLLSFDEPTRFIFSHSALREGWDNPNVFQICTLKHSDNQTAKRQEVGRGLRLCVNQSGDRMDSDLLGQQVHDVNMLTVIASESYKTFVGNLQDDIKKVLYDRPTKATIEYFEGKTVKDINDIPVVVTNTQAKELYKYLYKNEYIDNDDSITSAYRNAVAESTLAPLPDALKPIENSVHKLVQSVFDPSVLKDMFGDANKTTPPKNEFNENFEKFKELWDKINHKYVYEAKIDTDALIKMAVDNINKNLSISQLMYASVVGSQKDTMNQHELERGDSFETEQTRTKSLKNAVVTNIKYDLVGVVAEETALTRKTIATIFKNLDEIKLQMFHYNPEEFIARVVRLIKEVKAKIIVPSISYYEIEEKYPDEIFTNEKLTRDLNKVYKAKKHILDYVLTDGVSENNNERRFAKALDDAFEVLAYAKLPREYQIPTPVGNYTPDWAIAFKEGTVKHIFFIAETKGSSDEQDLRQIELSKIQCATKLFNEISTHGVRYHVVTDYQNMLNRMDSID